MTKNEIRFEKIEKTQELTIELAETTEILMAYYLILRENSEFSEEKEAIEMKAQEKINYIDGIKKHIRSLRNVKTEKQLKTFNKELDLFMEAFN